MPVARARRARRGRGRAARGRRSSARSRTRASPSIRRRSASRTSRREGVERLYGGLEPALKRALAAVGTEWDARIGAAGRRFAALAAASVARPGQVVVVADEELPQFLAPLPLTLLPLERSRYEELEALGVRKLGQLAGLPGGAVAERLGPDGRRAWSLARGGTAARVRGRRPPAAVDASLEFPEAIGNELTLRRALAGLVDTGARAAGAARPLRPQARAGRAARERRLVAADADAARAERRLRPDPHRALAAARRAAGSGRRAPARARRARPSRPATSSSCSPPAPRTAPACGKGCARCGRAPAPAPSAPSWRWRHGRAFRRAARCSFRRTSSRTLQRAAGGARRGGRERTAARGEPPASSRSSARSGASSTAGGRRSRSSVATSRSCSRPARTPSSSTTARAGGWYTQRGA